MSSPVHRASTIAAQGPPRFDKEHFERYIRAQKPSTETMVGRGYSIPVGQLGSMRLNNRVEYRKLYLEVCSLCLKWAQAADAALSSANQIWSVVRSIPTPNETLLRKLAEEFIHAHSVYEHHERLYALCHAIHDDLDQIQGLSEAYRVLFHCADSSTCMHVNTHALYKGVAAVMDVAV